MAFPPDFDVYPPEVTEELDAGGAGVQGVKSYEYVLVPRAPGLHTIPAVELAYFDAAGGRYAVAASDSITVDVTGDVVAGDPVLIGRPRNALDAARQDIRFIRVAASAFVPVDRQLFRSGVFWTVLLLPVPGVAGALALRRHRERLEGNLAYARRRRAARVARSRLAQARALRTPGQHRACVAGISQALIGFLGDTLNIAEAGLVREDIRRALAARGVAGEVRRRSSTRVTGAIRRATTPGRPSRTSGSWRAASRAASCTTTWGTPGSGWASSAGPSSTTSGRGG